MKLFIKLLRDRKGISMTEVVIAMAVVLVVTGASISLLIASVQSDAKYLARSQALVSCENAVECVRFADGEAKLTEALEKLGFAKSVTDAGYYLYTMTSGDETVEVRYVVDNEEAVYVVLYNDEIIYEKTQSI